MGNAPEFLDRYDGKEAVYTVFEHIDNPLSPTGDKTVKAKDADRCWYGAGLVQFEAVKSENFKVSGGNNEDEKRKNNCDQEPTATIELTDSKIIREKLPNGFLDGNNYSLQVRATDMPDYG